MNPTAARNQAIILSLFLTLTTFVIPPQVGLATALGVLALALGAWLAYMRKLRDVREKEANDKTKATLPLPPELPAAAEVDREGKQRRWTWQNPADSMVLHSHFIAAIPSAAVSLILLIAGTTPAMRIPYWERLAWMAVPFVIIFALIYLGTLADWYYVLPQMSGTIRRPPCRSGDDRQWITVSRLWLLIRWIGIVLGPIGSGPAFFGGLVYFAVAFAGIDKKDQITLAFNSFGASVLLTGIGVGIQFKLLDRLNDILNPVKVVGKIVYYQGNPHYIVDVSHQGTKVNRVAGRTRYGGEPFPNHKGKMVDPKELSLEDEEFPFRGCERQCCGVNFYCDYNWRKGRYR